MKRTWVVLFTAFLFAGCGGEKKETSSELKKDDSKSDLSPQLQITDSVEPMTDEATEFGKQLQQLSAKANQQQAEYQFAEAAKTWREVEAILNREFGATSWQAVNARQAGDTAAIEAEFTPDQIEKLKEIFNKQNMVGVSLRDSDVAKAMELSVDSAMITQELFGPNSFMMGKQLMQLGRMYQQVGHLDTAVEDFSRASKILKEYLGELHPDLEICNAYLGEVYLAQGNLTNAIAAHNRATEIAKMIWGDSSLRYAARANDLGSAYHQNRQHDMAVKVLRVAEEIRRTRLNPSHPQVAHSLTNLGIVYLDMGHKELAETSLSQAHDTFRQHYGDKHGLTADCKSKLATVKMLLQKPNEAEILLTQLINLVEDNSNPVAISTLQYRLGIALARQGKYDRAEPLFQSCLELQKSNFGEAHEATVATMNAYALLLKQSNRVDEANAIYNEITRVAQQPAQTNFR